MGQATAAFNPPAAKSMIFRISMDLHKMINRSSVKLCKTKSKMRFC
ncbi:hypothetical protein [Azospirillum palustre]